MPIQKLYCFVDESGQDTLGECFYVVVIVVEGEFVDTIRQELVLLEESTGKRLSKWKRTKLEARQQYLQGLKSIISSHGLIYFSSFQNTHEYVTLTAFTLVQAIVDYSDILQTEVTIVIDGLNEKDRERVLKVVKGFHIRYKKVRGATDESEPILRLADSVAGLIRDADEGQSYAKKVRGTLIRKNILSEAKK